MGDRSVEEEVRESVDRRIRQIVNHDLRSPLAVVVGQCDLLRLRAGPQLNPTTEQSLVAIESAVARVDAGLAELSSLLVETRSPPAG